MTKSGQAFRANETIIRLSALNAGSRLASYRIWPASAAGIRMELFAMNFFRLPMLVSALLAVAATAPPRLVLSGTGVVVAGKRMLFEKTLRADAIRRVSAELGAATKTGSYGDCGHGDVITYAKFPGGFELSFVKGRLSGWTQDTAALPAERGVRVGMTVAALRKAYPDMFFDKGDEANGGVSANFQRDGGPNGWIESVRSSAHVTGLFAGATCLPGV